MKWLFLLWIVTSPGPDARTLGVQMFLDNASDCDVAIAAAKAASKANGQSVSWACVPYTPPPPGPRRWS